MQKRAIVHALLTIAFGVVFASTAFSHHGWNGYDASKTITLTGTIRESSYDNPHATIRLQAEGDQSKVWLVVLAPPSPMHTRGLEKDALAPGTAATVIGYSGKSNPDELRAERIIIGGKTTELR